MKDDSTRDHPQILRYFPRIDIFQEITVIEIFQMFSLNKSFSEHFCRVHSMFAYVDYILTSVAFVFHCWWE